MSEIKVGMRLRCETCGTEVIVVRPPDATDAVIRCCGSPMVPLDRPGGSAGG